MDKARLEARALLLIRKHGVAQKNVLGAYHAQPQRSVEYLFHEVAHWLTLGNSIQKLPRNLSNRILETFPTIVPRTANILEIDASFVTYLAGYMLGLWQDCGPIAKSCVRNLNGMPALGDPHQVVEAFERRWTPESDRQAYVRLATVLVKWFRPSAKIPCLGEKFPEQIEAQP